MVKNLPAMRENLVQSLGWEDSPRGGHGKPLWYSCLENPNGFAWRAIVYGVTKSQTTEQLSTDINFIIILTVFFSHLSISPCKL